ncbi:MAG: energy transducer TonB [Pseudomonadota bacterium]
MIRLAMLILLSVFFIATSYAEPTEDDFAEAWQDYAEARRKGNKSRTLKLSRRVLDIGQSLLADDDPRMPVLMGNYARALSHSGKREEAAAQYAAALARAESVYAADSDELLTFLQALAREGTGTAESDAYYQRALAIRESISGRDSVAYVQLNFERAVSRFTAPGEIAKKKQLDMALQSYRDDGETDSTNLAYALYQRGRVETSQKSQQSYLEEALGLVSEDSPAGRFTSIEARKILIRLYDARGDSERATEHLISVGQLQGNSGEDYLPVMRAAPRYPMKYLRTGTSGHVDLEFSVDELGYVRNPVAVAVVKAGVPAKSVKSEFADAAIDAVRQFRYAPRFEGGEPIVTDGVQTRISFKIER